MLSVLDMSRDQWENGLMAEETPRWIDLHAARDAARLGGLDCQNYTRKVLKVLSFCLDTADAGGRRCGQIAA